jgi:pilus assembly protein Flp/PilA
MVRFLKDESGATAIEYAVIASGVALAIIAIVGSLGGTLTTLYSGINSQLR